MVRFDIQALESFTQTHEVVLRLPDTLAITGGTPSGYTVDQDTPPDLTPAYDVLWSAMLTEDITQTFSLNILPSAVTAGPLYDGIEAHVHLAGAGRYDGLSEALWLRVGDANQPGAVTMEWPNAFSILAGGFRVPNAMAGPVVASVDGGPPVPLPTVSAEDLPATEPLAAELQIDQIVDADTSVAMTLTVRNSGTTTVSYTGALTLPDAWVVLAGPPQLDTTLPPGQNVTFTYDVLPREVPCTWGLELDLRVDEQTIALGYDDLRLEVPGGLYPCDGAAGGLEQGEAAAGRRVFVAPPEREPVRPCESGPCGGGGPPPPCLGCNLPAPTCPRVIQGEKRMTVHGRVFAVHDPADSYLARLRLRILEGRAPSVKYHPDEPLKPPPTGRELAEIRLDDLGQFFVCIERVPNFYLEVTATDQVECRSDWAAETVFDPNQKLRYLAYSPTWWITPSPSCWLDIDADNQYIEDWTRGDQFYSIAFFPATMIAFEMRDFMMMPDPTSVGVDIGMDDRYRAKFSYLADDHRMREIGCFTEGDDHENAETAPACYRPDYIYLGVTPPDQMDVIDHEYGHRAHDANGGWDVADTTQFPEGIAELLRAVKETIITQYRGVCYGRPWVAFRCKQSAEHHMEIGPTRPITDTTTERYAAYLYDIWDQAADSMPEAASDPGCENYFPPSSDQLAIGFGNLWDTFTQSYNHQGVSFPMAGREWTQQWVNVTGWHYPEANWSRMLTIAFHHGIYDSCAAFPGPTE